jgi:hypothetical protein
VKQWIAHIRKSANPVVRSCNVLVRPHPAHLKQWKDVDLCRYAGVALWTGREVMNADQGLYDSLHHASAVVGLNTSAMIEAGILGRSVLTMVTGEFAGGQEQTLHFQYLRASNGGLLHEARNFEEHDGQLAEALRREGADLQARAFVERFVRPRGLDAPVTPIMVKELERAARIRKQPRHAAMWHHPARAALRTVFALRRRG